MPYGFLCLKCLMLYQVSAWRASCSTCSCTSCALCITWSSALRRSCSASSRASYTTCSRTSLILHPRFFRPHSALLTSSVPCLTYSRASFGLQSLCLLSLVFLVFQLFVAWTTVNDYDMKLLLKESYYNNFLFVL